MRYYPFLAFGVAFALAGSESCDPARDRFNKEQVEICKKAGGLPIVEYSPGFEVPEYKGCQLPCQPTVISGFEPTEKK